MNFIKTLTADNTTAELACESRGVTRSQMLAGVDDIEEKEQEISQGLLQTSDHWRTISMRFFYFILLSYLWDSRSSRGV